MSDLTLVGENPGGDLTLEPFDPGRPVMSLSLTGRAGRTMCELGGWHWYCYLAYTERRNLFYSPQRPWSAPAAQASAARMIPELESQRVVLLGAKVATAFGLAGYPHYQWTDLSAEQPGFASVALMPHPSGLNRKWNDPAERARARAFLHGLLEC